MRKCTSYAPMHFVWESDSDEEEDDDDSSLADPNGGSDAGTAETTASTEPMPPCAQASRDSGGERAEKLSDDSDCSVDPCGNSDAETAESATSVKSMLGPPGNWGPRTPIYINVAAVGRDTLVQGGRAELKAFRPQDTAPQFRAGGKGEALPSIGSAGHSDARCRPCAFFNQGVCGAGASCDFCHMKHKRNYHAQSKKKRERYRRLIAFKKAVKTVASVGTIGDDQGNFHRYQW